MESNTIPQPNVSLMEKLFDPEMIKGLNDDELIDLLQKKLASLYLKNNMRVRKQAPDVIKQLVNLAFSDILDYVELIDNEPVEAFKLDEFGNKEETLPTKKLASQSIKIKNLLSLTDDQRAAIESIEQTKYGLKLKLQNKLGPLDLLVKHFGLVVQRFEHTGADGGPIETVQNRRIYVVPAINKFSAAKEVEAIYEEKNR